MIRDLRPEMLPKNRPQLIPNDLAGKGGMAWSLFLGNEVSIFNLNRNKSSLTTLYIDIILRISSDYRKISTECLVIGFVYI